MAGKTDNDELATGSFAVVHRKPRKNLKRTSMRSRLISSILVAVMCALLGFAYMTQINNSKSTYETMVEELAQRTADHVENNG